MKRMAAVVWAFCAIAVLALPSSAITREHVGDRPEGSETDRTDDSLVSSDSKPVCEPTSPKVTIHGKADVNLGGSIGTGGSDAPHGELHGGVTVSGDGDAKVQRMSCYTEITETWKVKVEVIPLVRHIFAEWFPLIGNVDWMEPDVIEKDRANEKVSYVTEPRIRHTNEYTKYQDPPGAAAAADTPVTLVVGDSFLPDFGFMVGTKVRFSLDGGQSVSVPIKGVSEVLIDGQAVPTGKLAVGKGPLTAGAHAMLTRYKVPFGKGVFEVASQVFVLDQVEFSWSKSAINLPLDGDVVADARVTNNTGSDRYVNVSFTAPKGVTVLPLEAPVKLKAHETRTLGYLVHAYPADGSATSTVVAKPIGGDSSELSVTVTAPMNGIRLLDETMTKALRAKFPDEKPPKVHP